MEVTPIEVIQWLKDEIEKQTEKKTKQEDNKQELSELLFKLQQKKKALTETLIQAQTDLANAQQNAQAELVKIDIELQKIQETLNRKEQICNATDKEKDALSKQLMDTQRQASPILQEIVIIKEAIDKLQDEILLKNKLLLEREEIPKKIEKLRKRLIKALSLKVGYIQKIAITEELLNEITLSNKDEVQKKLTEYKQLCQELQPLVFEQ